MSTPIPDPEPHPEPHPVPTTARTPGSGDGGGDGGAHASLREPRHRVSRTAQGLWAVGAAIRGTVLVVVLVGVEQLGWWDVPWWVYVVAVVVLAGYAALMPVVRYRIHRWESTETAVYTQVGWLSRERRIAPMSKVQTVDLGQSATARLFGLATVTVTTASAAGPLRIDGIDRDVALQLVADLTRRTESEAGDAT